MPTGASKDCLADFDVLVIGAGAAGLAAGRRLARSPLSFRILEARARPGGRGFTDSASGHALDHGCGWLHSADRNPWRGIDKTLPAWGEQAFDLGFSRQDQHDFAKASEAFHARVFNSAKTSKDQAASRLLETASRWNPLLNAVSTYMSGSALDDISVFDFAAYADSEINWRVREGFGTAITTFGGDLPVALDSAVSEIDHGGTPLRLETAKGPLKARAVIITVPASLLVCGALRFRPDLPEKRAAAEGLPLGIADKLFIALDQPEDMPIDGHLFGRTDRVETASYHLRPFGRPLIEAYFGGDLARALEKSGPAAFFQFACDELALLFGEAIRPRLHFITATSWALDVFAQGSYSYARPLHADARQKLAQSIDQRLFFAGEACSAHYYSTAQGAYETGFSAAEQALAALLPKPTIKAS